MLIPNLNPTALQTNMLGGSKAIFKSLTPIAEMLIGAYIGFWILSFVIKLIRNHADDLTERRETKELKSLAKDLGYKLELKDLETIEKEHRFKELKKIYSDKFDFEKDDDDDDDDNVELDDDDEMGITVDE